MKTQQVEYLVIGVELGQVFNTPGSADGLLKIVLTQPVAKLSAFIL